jgi:hypothetical protein
MPDLRLEQSAWLRGKQVFEVRQSEDMIRIRTDFQSTLNEFQIPLNIIAPEPNRFKTLNMAGIITMAIFGSLSVLMVILAIFQEKNEAWMLLFFLPLFFAGLRQHRRLSLDAQIFHSRINGQNLLVLWRNNPTLEVFGAFSKGLQERLRKVEIPISSPVNQSIADELRKLGDLKKDGIISESEFNDAKAKLLGAFEQRKIGFN